MHVVYMFICLVYVYGCVLFFSCFGRFVFICLYVYVFVLNVHINACAARMHMFIC